MQSYQNQSKLYKVLMHPTRLAILEILRSGEQCVCHMEAVFGLRQAHISQHLMVLREAGLVSDRRDGWNIFYRVYKPEIYTVIDAMNGFSDAAIGEETHHTESHVTPRAKSTACPCPKCNTDSAALRSESTSLELARVKASV